MAGDCPSPGPVQPWMPKCLLWFEWLWYLKCREVIRRFFFSFLISLGSPNLNITVLSSKSSQQKFLFSTVGCDACWSELWVLSTRLRFLPWLLLVHRLQFNFVRTLRTRIAFSKKDCYLWVGRWLIFSSKSLKLWVTYQTPWCVACKPRSHFPVGKPRWIVLHLTLGLGHVALWMARGYFFCMDV